MKKKTFENSIYLHNEVIGIEQADDTISNLLKETEITNWKSA